MKSPRKLRTLLLWLTAAVVMTITFRMASTRTPNNHQPQNHSPYVSRVEGQSSAHLVEAALRKVDFPQTLNPIERAALHQPLRLPSGTTLLPDHSLFVEAIPVVEDPNLTWDPCLVTNGNPSTGGNQIGAWTFNELMLAVAGTTDSNPKPAEQILTSLLYNFANPNGVTIGNFTAKLRPDGQNFFNSWPVDHTPGVTCNNPINSGECLSLLNAPVHLNAIVNRIDIGQNGSSDQAGMLRFVFGVTMNTTNGNNGQNGTGCQNSGNQLFNIILEYNVPSSITAQSWAQSWLDLSNDCPNGFNSPDCNAQGGAPGDFNYDLNQIVQQVVKKNAGVSGAPNGSALADLRTNEAELDNDGVFWELRQFQFGGGSTNPIPLVETALTQTPDLSFDGGSNPGDAMFCTISNQDQNNRIPGCSNNLGEVEALITGNESAIENGTFSLSQVDNGLLEAVSALNATIFWDSSPSMANNANIYIPKVIFAAGPQFINGKTGSADPQGGIDGTCNGCHGTDTETTFRHVENRAAGTGNDQPSPLSGFLVGCNQGNTRLIVGCPTPPPQGCGGSGNPCVFPLTSPGCEVVQDPVFNGTNGEASFANTFGDILRRVNCMNTILNPNSPPNVICNGAGLPPQTNGTCP